MPRSLMMRVIATAGAVAIAMTTLAAAAPARARAHSLVGTLQKVDGQTLTIQTAKGSETVMLGPTATVRSGSKTLSASDLNGQTGSRVKVRYTENAGQKQAQSVAVSAKPAQTARVEPKTSQKTTQKK